MISQQERKALLGIARKVGGATVKAIGKGRARRAKAGKWYFGRKVGIPPNSQGRVAARISGLATTKTNTRAPNLGQQLTNLQSPASRGEQGTESFGTVVAVAADMKQGFYLSSSTIVNPAEPLIFPALSAIANQYQRFTINRLIFTFTPTASTATNGTVYMAFVPNPDQTDPEDVVTMQNLLGCTTQAVYGTQAKLIVTAQTLQQAYRVQQIYKPETPGEIETSLNAAGKFYFGVSGMDTFTGVRTLGTVSCTYSFTFSTRQMTLGSNEISGTASFNGASEDLVLERETGQTFFLADRFSDLRYGMRMATPATALLTVHQAGSDLFDLETSPDDVTWTAVTPVSSTTVVGSAISATYLLKWERFIRYSCPDAGKHIGVHAYVATLSRF